MGSIVPPQSTNVALTLKTDYCGNMIYENGQLSKILTDGGYITLANSTPTYHYYLQDHLGNNRVVIDEHGQVEQVNHYYAFGGLMGESTGGGTQPYKYNGKELDRMHGLDWYDYGARYYDAVLGRWMCVDPLANRKPRVSGYVMCLDNPLKYIDSDGLWEWNGKGNLVAQKGDDAHTLAEFFGTSDKNAMDILMKSGIKPTKDGVLDLKIGEILDKKNFQSERVLFYINKALISNSDAVGDANMPCISYATTLR